MSDYHGPALSGSTYERIYQYEQRYGDRFLNIYYQGGAISDPTLTYAYPKPESTSNVTDVTYTLTWSGSATDVMIAFGGHIAAGVDRPRNAGWGQGYGPPTSAALRTTSSSVDVLLRGRRRRPRGELVGGGARQPVHLRQRRGRRRQVRHQVRGLDGDGLPRERASPASTTGGSAPTEDIAGGGKRRVVSRMACRPTLTASAVSSSSATRSARYRPATTRPRPRSSRRLLRSRSLPGKYVVVEASNATTTRNSPRLA